MQLTTSEILIVKRGFCSIFLVFVALFLFRSIVVAEDKYICDDFFCGPSDEYYRRKELDQHEKFEAARQKCAKTKGRWVRHMLPDSGHCVYKTKDANRPCRDSKECEGPCVVAGKFNPKRPPKTGICSPWTGRLDSSNSVCPLTYVLKRS